MMTIQGSVIVDKDTPSFSDANLYVLLEDVSRIDARAKIIHKFIKKNISHSRGNESVIDFKFDAKESVNSNPRYNLRAHVDISCSGEVNLGDLVSMQSYPVHKQYKNHHYNIEVKKVI